VVRPSTLVPGAIRRWPSHRRHVALDDHRPSPAM